MILPPTSQICHRHICLPTSVTNIDVTEILSFIKNVPSVVLGLAGYTQSSGTGELSCILLVKSFEWEKFPQNRLSRTTDL